MRIGPRAGIERVFNLEWTRGSRLVALALVFAVAAAMRLPALDASGFAEDEIDKLVSVARDYLWDRKQPDARPYLLISLLLQTGIKKAECDNMLVEDIDLSEPQAPVAVIRYAEERNAHKNRRLPLDPNILPALRQYLDQ